MDEIDIVILNQSIKNDHDTIEYLIRNISDKTVHLPMDPNNFYRNDLDENIINFLEISFELHNENNELILPEVTSFFPKETFSEKKDSFLQEYEHSQKINLQKKPYHLSENNFLNQEYIKKNTIIIPPKKELRFKTPIEIHSYSRINSLDLQYYVLEKNHSYYLKIKIHSHLDSLQKYLPNKKARNLLLHKELESNPVPLDIVVSW